MRSSGVNVIRRCSECDGSGVVRRDETCEECGGLGGINIDTLEPVPWIR